MAIRLLEDSNLFLTSGYNTERVCVYEIVESAELTRFFVVVVVIILVTTTRALLEFTFTLLPSIGMFIVTLV